MNKLVSRYQWLLTSILFFVILAIYLCIGSVSIPLHDVAGLFLAYLTHGSQYAAEHYPLTNAIIAHIRLPRACAAILAGGALALAGACSQGLFKNPLASPDILGISAGSSFAAVLAIVTGISASSLGGLPLFTTMGALASAALVYLLAVKSAQQGLFIILAGLAVSSLLGGLTMGVLLTAQQYEVSEFVFWTMGGLDSRIWQQLLWPTPIILIAAVILLRHGQILNLLSFSALGEQNAHGMGVNVKRSRLLLLGLTTLLTAMAIVVAGPIGFIGLIVPHLVRLVLGP